MSDFTHDWLLKWVVGHDRDLRMPSLSSTELWILNKSMASDWTLEPLANEKHFWEVSTHHPWLQSSRLFLTPQLHLHPSASIFDFTVSLTLYPSPTRHTHTHTHMCIPRRCFPSVPQLFLGMCCWICNAFVMYEYIQCVCVCVDVCEASVGIKGVMQDYPAGRLPTSSPAEK